MTGSVNFLTAVIWIYPLFFAAACYAVVKYTDFYVSQSDFWGNYYMSRRLDFKNPATFHNGFYPLGYPLFLRIFSFGRPLTLPFIYNILFGVVVLYAVAFISFASMERLWVLMCVVTLSLMPKFFEYATRPGPDKGMVAFSAAGASLLLTVTVIGDGASNSAFWIFISGILFGFGALWRYHGMVFAFGFIFAAAIFSDSPAWTFLLPIAGFFLVYSVQMIVNVLSGHGLFETCQSFHVHNMTHGVDWDHIFSLDIPKTIRAVISASPEKFFSAYLFSLAEMAPYLLPSLLCTVFLKDPVLVKMGAVAGVAFLFYIPVVSMGRKDIDRAELPLLPFVTWQVYLLASFAFMQISRMLESQTVEAAGGLLILAALAATYAFSWLNRHLSMAKNRKRVGAIFRSIEELLDKEGVKSTDQVFSTAAELYFRNKPPYFTFHRFSGGWSRFNLYGFNEEYPIPGCEVEALLDFCESRGITHVILTSNCNMFAPQLDKVYNGKLKPARLEMIAHLRSFKLYRITG